jgi:hypothetical protein
MRELHYGNGILIVAAEVCDAVFLYAKALANANKADVVTVPILVHGKRAHSNILLGPSSELFCTPAEQIDVDLGDPELVADLGIRAKLLNPSHPVPVESLPIADFATEYD